MKRSTLVVVGLAALAVCEVALLSVVGRAIGVLPLVAILIGEGLLGSWLVRREGAKAWASLRAAQREPDQMGSALGDAGLILTGALLLILPGFISDAVGALFLLPPTRVLAKRGIVGVFRALTRRYRDQAGLLSAKADPGSVVEGSVETEPQRRRPDDTIVRGTIEP